MSFILRTDQHIIFRHLVPSVPVRF